jgi:hypothetical protein
MFTFPQNNTESRLKFEEALISWWKPVLFSTKVVSNCWLGFTKMLGIENLTVDADICVEKCENQKQLCSRMKLPQYLPRLSCRKQSVSNSCGMPGFPAEKRARDYWSATFAVIMKFTSHLNSHFVPHFAMSPKDFTDSQLRLDMANGFRVLNPGTLVSFHLTGLTYADVVKSIPGWDFRIVSFI